MATTSFTALRRLAGFTFTLTLLSLGLTGAAIGQGSPLVTVSAPAGLNHSSSTPWGVISRTTIDANGNWLVEEYPHGGLFEFPANCSPADSASGGPSCMITLVPLGNLEGGNTYWSGSIFLDPGQNLYIGGGYSNCLLMFPYGSAASPWPLLASSLGPNAGAPPAGVSGAGASDYCSMDSKTPQAPPGGLPLFAEGGTYADWSGSPGYFEPWAGASGQGYWANTIVIGTVNSGSFIFAMPVTGAWANPIADCSNCSTTTGAGEIPATELIAGLKGRPISVAVDPAGNVYFVEDWTNGAASYNEGVFEIPAGETNLTAPAGSYPETSLPRVDPNLPNVTGVVTDAQGNLYISDGTDGVFMVPNSNSTAGGTPQTAAAVMLTPVPAQGEVAIDPARKILYEPTTQKQSNGQSDVAKVGVGIAEFGSSNVGTATPAGLPVDFSFNGTVTPANFEVVEDGLTKPEFSISGGTCASGVAYGAESSCAENLTFTPAAVGSAAAKLLMVDKSGNILPSMMLHGTGMGANAQGAAGLESTIGSTLQTPTQVATDALGNVYVADPGLGEVLMYAPGSGTAVSVGTGLTAPTGVAVDGAGDVFIADRGTVYEVPFGPTGLNASGQVKVATGLGTSGLNLAADGLGDLYVADPTNGQVVKISGLGGSSAGSLAGTTAALTAGFTAPSAVAADSNSNLYVIDGSNLFELAGGVGAPTTVLNSLSGATGVAVDPSGAVYISSASGTERIPYVGGSLIPGSKTPIAPDVSDSSSVTLDRAGNVYVTPAGGAHVTLVSTTGTLNLGTAGSSTTASTSAEATITNIGNAPLLVSGYTSSSTVEDSLTIANFTGADGTCVADSTSPGTGIAAGGTCQVDITFDPASGQQGTLTGWVQATSNAIGAPITIDTTGTGVGLGGSQTTVTVGSSAQVISTPVSVTVASSGGSGTPTGTVQVSYTSWTVTTPTSCAAPPCAPTINPVTVTASSSLTNGQAQFNLAPVLAGSQTFTVGYSGDRVYGQSTGSVTATVAKSSITGFIGDQSPPTFLPFVQEQSGSTPYDGSQLTWQYNMPVTINTAAGIPTGTITFMDNSSTCPPGTSKSGQGAALCALANTSGVACPQAVGAGVQYVVNTGTPSTNAGGIATFVTSCLQMPEFTTYTPVVSTHYITPEYSGDVNFMAATDPAPTLFQVLRSSLVNITSSTPAAPSAPISTPSVNVQPGSTASVTLYLAPLLGYGFEGKGGSENDYNFPVSLACDNLPPNTQCTFSYPADVSPYQPSAPNSVQICPQPLLDSNSDTAAAYEALAESGGCNLNGAGVVTLTINTNVSTGTTTSENAAAPITLASLFGLGMIGLFSRRKSFEKGRRLLMVLLMAVGGALAASLTACNTTNLTPSGQIATPAGTYAVSITASQVGTQCVPQTGPGANCTTASGGTGLLVYGSSNQISLPYYVNVTVQ